MPSPDRGTPQLARGYLHRSLSLSNVDRRPFAKGQTTRDEIITTNRFILIVAGEMKYTVDGASATLRAGTQFLVPAWVRRVWTVPRSESCAICWCEFDDAGADSGPGGLLFRMLAPRESCAEALAYGRLGKEFANREEAWAALRAEATLKLMLVRFLEGARPHPKIPSGEPESIHPGIKAALRWARENFVRPDALEGMMSASGLSANYFRKLFSSAAQCGPHEHIEKLRMRRARHLLHSTEWQLKRVAAEAGYPDPLYFSRLYRRFWKHPPSGERSK